MYNNNFELPANEMTPTFRVLIEQANSITNIHSAIAEFIDNSIDAGSKKVYLETHSKAGPIDVFVMDDGCGMTFDNLVSALKSGQSIKTNEDKTTLGCKGQGMKSAAAMLAEKLIIYSKTLNSDKVSCATFDLKKLKDNPSCNTWNILYSFIEDTADDLPEPVKRHYDYNPSGTCLILQKITNFSKKEFDRKMMGSTDKSLRMIYRHMLGSVFELRYNDSELYSCGPGFNPVLSCGKKDKIFYSDDHTEGWIPVPVMIQDVKYENRIRFVRRAIKNSWGTSGAKGGLRILRNQRDITSQLIQGIRVNDYSFGNTVIELDCPSIFIDRHLTMGVDKQIRTLENKTNFDVRGWVKRLVNLHKDYIISINKIDAERYNESPPNKNKIKSTLREKTLVKRFIEAQTLLRGDSASIKTEHVLGKSQMRADLIIDDTLYEFKVNGECQACGQLLSYLPYWIEERGLKSGDVQECVLVVKERTPKIEDQVRLAENYTYNGIKLKIKIMAGGPWFQYSETSIEKES